MQRVPTKGASCADAPLYTTGDKPGN